MTWEWLIIIVGACILFFVSKKVFYTIEIKSAKGNETKIREIQNEYKSELGDKTEDREYLSELPPGIIHYVMVLTIIINLLLCHFGIFKIDGGWGNRLFQYLSGFAIIYIGSMFAVGIIHAVISFLGRFNLYAAYVVAIVLGAIWVCLK